MKRKHIYIFLLCWMIFTYFNFQGYQPNVLAGIGRHISFYIISIYFPYVAVIHFYYNEKYTTELTQYGYLEILKKKSKFDFINKIVKKVMIEVFLIVIFQVGFFLIVFGNKYSVEATVKMFFLYFTGMICMVLIQVFWELIFNKNTALIFILGYYTCAFTISSIIYDRAREFLKVIYLLVPSYMQGEFTNLTRTKDVGLYFSTFAALILIYILIIYIALQYAFKRKDII